MSNTPHTLAEEFPGKAESIHRLKTTDPRFATLLSEYDDVNDKIHRAETKIAPIEQFAEIDLRKERLRLKDAIVRAMAQ